MKMVTKCKIYCVGFLVTFSSSCGKINDINSEPNSSLYSSNQDIIQPKVLLIGIDGLLQNHSQRLIDPKTMPNLHEMKFFNSYTGGVTGTKNQAVTLSGPGWNTILTGTWVWKHGIANNAIPQTPKVPTLFKYIKEKYPNYYTASIYDWNAFKGYFSNDSKYIDVNEFNAPNGSDYSNSDRINFETAQRLIKDKADLGFAFVYFGNADEVGHHSGLGRDYENSIVEIYNFIETLISEVNTRKKERPNEDWLIVITTDHGRDKRGQHGGNTLNEKKTFIAFNKAPNDVFSQLSVNPNINDPLKANLYSYAAQADIAPTLLSFFGIILEESHYIFDGVSGLGNLGVNKLKVKYNSSTNCVDINWLKYHESLNESIYKNGVKIDATGMRVENHIAYLSDCSQIDSSTLKKVNYIVTDNNSTISSKLW